MAREIQLSLDPATAADMNAVRKKAAFRAGIDYSQVTSVRITSRSVDARKKDIKVNLAITVYSESDDPPAAIEPLRSQDVSKSREVIIAGAGPAGLFAALRLIELVIRPVIIERGREVSSRKRDIARISREHLVDPDSNYCFGEGGAGTFSDGKLYTRSKKRGDNTRVLELLHLHGADERILYEAHPHLGTDKLPAIITGIRKSITDSGGVVMLEKRITGILVESGGVKGVVTAGNEIFRSPYLILATGHSARDIYNMCLTSGITLQQKAFAAGVRVEHPQDLIDSIQYHGKLRGEYLPAASYSLVRQVDGRGVWSFCMCPGGFVVPSATSPEEVVVNGMSPSGRNSPYANSGIVVEIGAADLGYYARFGELAGTEFQKDMEREAWIQGGKTQRAPAQRLTDFVNGTFSQSLPSTSYFPGTTSSALHAWLPEVISSRLRKGFRGFASLMKGFLTEEAVVMAVESRTSSPVRIPRDPLSMEHITVSGLYPCGEGSGYSGGIVSSAVDGMKAAESIAVAFRQ